VIGVEQLADGAAVCLGPNQTPPPWSAHRAPRSSNPRWTIS